ncbi:MAG: lycopene cyclase domain-containing protein [Ferruginibacter sp.]
MNTHYTYLAILVAALAAPLLLSFDKKVAFYKSWRYLFPALLFPALIYIVWDIYFVSQGVWRFNRDYIIGIKFINLPLEEVLFFFVVPYCCLFIYECIRSYFPSLKNIKIADVILKLLAVILLITGIIFYERLYTSWTFIATAIFIFCIYTFPKLFSAFDAASFLVSFIIILVPFLIVNGFLTSIPVVLYNDAENTGIRIYTIPVEDIFYGMLLVMMNICIYGKIKAE